MINEPFEAYIKDNFDHDGHLAVFLLTSARYLGVTHEHGVRREASDIQNKEA
jgi:hypothetical protein